MIKSIFIAASLMASTASIANSKELVAVCASPYSLGAFIQSSFGAPSLGTWEDQNSQQTQASTSSTVEIYKDGDSFDIVATSAFGQPRSLSAEGSAIQGLTMGTGMYHVMVMGDGSEEHFLLSMDDTGHGSLLWGSDQSDTNGKQLEFDGECVAP